MVDLPGKAFYTGCHKKAPVCFLCSWLATLHGAPRTQLLLTHAVFGGVGNVRLCVGVSLWLLMFCLLLMLPPATRLLTPAELSRVGMNRQSRLHSMSPWLARRTGSSCPTWLDVLLSGNVYC